MIRRILIPIVVASITGSCSDSDKLPRLDRIEVWGENYFDLTEDSNSLENTLDLSGLESLFGAKFEIDTGFYVNNEQTIKCCPIKYREESYYVTEPRHVGSFNNSTFGYDFYIRKPDDLSHETDTMLSLYFDSYRRLTSVTFMGGIFGSSRQLYVSPDSYEPSISLASSTRSAMRTAMKGDGHKDDYWNYMPNFAEKFIVAVDNHVKRP
jgi:hypothetical protein